MSLLAAVGKLVILHVNALDPRPERQDPILRIAVLHHVADIEMRLQPRAVELVDERAHFERAEQELVPDVFRREAAPWLLCGMRD